MGSFKEKDVRRHYDLLQHKPEQGLTQLKAMDGENIIGIGLFDNEDDFVSECHRYNELGSLHAGVNPRSLRLLDDYGGLKNRMRTLFMDVVGETDVDFVTGVAAPGWDGLSEAARRFRKDATVLFDGEILFPMDAPIPVAEGGGQQAADQLVTWLYGTTEKVSISLLQFTRVMGTALEKRGWLSGSRTKFRKYRPYILEGVSAAITGKEASGGGARSR